MFKKSALFLFAMGVAASAAWALPDDGGYYACKMECRRSYNYCTSTHQSGCSDFLAQCYAYCDDAYGG